MYSIYSPAQSYDLYALTHQHVFVVAMECHLFHTTTPFVTIPPFSLTSRIGIYYVIHTTSTTHRDSSLTDTTCILPPNSNPNTANVTDTVFLPNVLDHSSEFSSLPSTTPIPSDPRLIQNPTRTISVPPHANQPLLPIAENSPSSQSIPSTSPGPGAPIRSLSRHTASSHAPATDQRPPPSHHVSPHPHANVWPSSNPYCVMAP